MSGYLRFLADCRSPDQAQQRPVPLPARLADECPQRMCASQRSWQRSDQAVADNHHHQQLLTLCPSGSGLWHWPVGVCANISVTYSLRYKHLQVFWQYSCSAGSIQAFKHCWQQHSVPLVSTQLGIYCGHATGLLGARQHRPSAATCINKL